MFTHRYDRNQPLISSKKQSELREVAVAIVGLGGLGGHVAELCTRLGIGRLILIDGDAFEETNLNRQRFATESRIGKAKVFSAKADIESINSETIVEAHQVWLKDEADIDFFLDADFIIDCLDNVDTRILLGDFSVQLKIPLIHGSLSGWEGQYGLFLPDKNYMEQLYAHVTKGKAAVTANLPTLPPIVASMQINLLLAYLLNDSHLHPNTLFRFNVQTHELTKIGFS
ncbi:MAG TPA: HesA/MoeB/ThiF family protein [Fastidiosipila sp.]|nr:HesA/MoeB/ThiF family protein [Fastidiosipila sp.]